MYMATNLWETHTGNNYSITRETLKTETARTTYKTGDEFY